MQNVSYFIISGFVLLVVIYAMIKRVDAYHSFINGAKDSFELGLSIFPVLLIMYTSVRIFKACGILADLISFDNVPNDLLIQGIFRPISSHASLSMMASILNEFGPDSKEGIASSVLQGGSDTTVYVMGLYYSSVKIKKTRHSYIVGLICDLINLICVMILFLLFL